MNTETPAILDSLEPLFQRAEREGLWFCSPYQSLWFSPKELRAAHAKRQFIWGPVNWELRDPKEYRDALRKQGLDLLQQADAVSAKIAAR